ncbi:MAG: exodeoxyribonuclease gamma subunit [Verrucomicrobiota bacterium]
MLSTYFSHRTEDLFGHLRRVLDHRRDPLAPEILLVQSQGMARWLQLELTKADGISAHLYLPNPRAFIEQVLVACRCMEPQSGRSLPFWGPGGFAAERPWLDREMLAWRILAALQRNSDAVEPSESPVLDGYVKGDSLRAFRLSTQLAQVFDDYQLFRYQDLIEMWRQGRPGRGGSSAGLPAEIENWQSRLLRQVSQNRPESRALCLTGAIHQFLKTPLAEVGKLLAESRLPERISIFGMAALPPDFLRFFAHLGRLRQVSLFAFNPSQEFWGADSRRSARLALCSGQRGGLIDHPLLGAWGRQGKDLLNQLLELDEVTPEGEASLCDINFLDSPPPPEESNLLKLQQAVLTSTPELTAFSPPLYSFSAAASGDDSLGFHSCRSPLREVEILREFLLRQFALDPGLRSEDVLILTPDLETYAPLVQAVFSRTEPRSLPLSIADGGGVRLSPAAAVLLNLLGLDSSRCTASELLDILEFPAVSERFQLAADDLLLLRAKLKDAGLHWGLDAAHHFESCGLAFDEFSWDWALKRLICGYGAGEAVLPELAAVPMTSRNDAAALDSLLRFHQHVVKLRNDLRRPHSPEEWQILLSSLLEDFFAAPPEDQELRRDLSDLHRGLGYLANAWREADFSQALEAPVLRAALQEYLESPDDSAAGFIRGGITLARLLPMRSIPAQVIAMIGMNEGGFPRQDRLSSFNLMRRDPRLGDRSASADDRFLFLETLMAARRNLFLSWVGRDPQKEESLPPATPVAELLSCLGEAPDGTTWIHQPPMHSFSPLTFLGAGSYAASTAQACRDLLRGAAPPRFCPEPLPIPGEWRQEGLFLNLRDLESLLRNGPRFFCEKRLGLYLAGRDEDGIEDAECFATPGELAQHGLKQQMLELIDAGRTDAETLRILALRRAGDLPFRSAERSGVLQSCLLPMRQLAQKPLSPATGFSSFALTHSVDGVRIFFEAEMPVEPVWQARCLSDLMDEKGAKLKKPYHLVRHWAAAAAFAKRFPDGVYSLHAPDSSHRIESPLALTRLLELALEGLTRPLPISEKVLAELIGGSPDWHELWHGGFKNQVPASSKDPFFSLCFGDETPWTSEIRSQLACLLPAANPTGSRP